MVYNPQSKIFQAFFHSLKHQSHNYKTKLKSNHHKLVIMKLHGCQKENHYKKMGIIEGKLSKRARKL